MSNKEFSTFKDDGILRFVVDKFLSVNELSTVRFLCEFEKETKEKMINDVVEKIKKVL